MASPEGWTYRVATLTFSDQAAAYQQFRCYFAGQSSLLEGMRPSDLPPVFGVDVVGGPAAAQALYDRYQHVPGVQAETFRPGLVTPTLTAVPPALAAELPPGAASASGTMVVKSPPRPCPITATTLK